LVRLRAEREASRKHSLKDRAPRPRRSSKVQITGGAIESPCLA
jgi:hypothetical protein